MTLEDLIKRVWDLCAANEVPQPAPDVIETLKEAALQALAIQVATSDDPRYRGYGQFTFHIVMAAGRVDLSAEPALMQDFVWRVDHPVHGTLSHAKDRTYLALPKQPMGGFWYSIEESFLYCRGDDGITPGAAGIVDILANQVNTLTNLNVRLDDDLATIVFGLIKGGGADAQAAA